MKSYDEARRAAYDKARERSTNVREAAHGRWDTILQALLPELGAAFMAAPLHRKPQHVTCPYHGGRNDFRMDENWRENGGAICSCRSFSDGFALIQHAKGCSFIDVVAHIEGVLGGACGPIITPHVTYKKTAVDIERDDARIISRIDRTLAGTVALDTPEALPVRNWFRNRGLDPVYGPLDDLRFHPALPYYIERKEIGRFPAMIAMVRCPNGKLTTIHRTYLTSDGHKADVPTARKQEASPSTHPLSGAALRFEWPEGPVLNIGEGIESSLAARCLTDLPTWSCLNKSILTHVVIPDHVKIVTIWGDRDRSGAGEDAGTVLVDRLRAEGRRAVLFLPPFEIPDDKKSIDWNDVLQSVGHRELRNHLSVRTWRRRVDELLAEMRNSGEIPKAAHG